MTTLWLVPTCEVLDVGPALAGGYDKKTQAKDIRAVVTTLGFDQTAVVSHDIGNVVAYAYTAMYSDEASSLVVIH